MPEFLDVFSSVNIYEKIDPDTTCVLEVPSAQAVPHARIGIAPGAASVDQKASSPATTASTGQPFFYCFDSMHPTQVLVSFASAPQHAHVPPKVTSPAVGADTGPAAHADTGKSLGNVLSVADDNDKLAIADATVAVSGRATGTPPLATSGHLLGSADDSPQHNVSGVVLEEFHWKLAARGSPRGVLCTLGDAGTTLTLPAGKQVFRIVLQHSGACSVAISVPRGFGGVSRIVNEHAAYATFGEESLRLQTHAVQIGKLIGLMVSDHSKWSVILQLITSMTTSPLKHLAALDTNVDFNTHVSPGMATFWAAILSSLALSLKTEWCTADGKLTPLAVAWTRLVVTWKLGPGPSPPSVADTTVATNTKLTSPAADPEASAPQRPDLSLEAVTPSNVAACVVIQRAFRAHQSRLRTRTLRAVAVARDAGMVVASWERLSKNLCDFTVLLFRRMFELSPSLKWQLVWDDDEMDRGFVQDHHLPDDSAGEKDAYEWFLLFKDTLVFASQTTALLQLRVSPPPSLTPEQHRAIEDSLQLDLFNNATKEHMPMAFNRPLTCDFEPTAAGYTVVACGQCAIPLPKCTFTLRVLSYPAFPLPPEQPLAVSLQPHVESGPVRVQTTPGSGVAGQGDNGETTVVYDVLFRYRVQVAAPVVASVHLGVNPTDVPGTALVLEVLENGTLVHTLHGAHSVYAPCVPLQASHTLAAAVQAADDADTAGGKGAGKGGKSSGKAGKERKGSAKSTTSSAAPSRPTTSTEARATPVPPPDGTDHTYVLIGRMTKGVPVRPLVLDGTQGDPRPAGDKAAGKKKGKGKPETASEPQWRLQIFGSGVEGEMVVAPFTQREDEIASVKIGWEVVNEGRAAQATAVRETFLETHATDGPSDQMTATAGDPTQVAQLQEQQLQVSVESVRHTLPDGPVRVFDDTARMEVYILTIRYHR